MPYGVNDGYGHDAALKLLDDYIEALGKPTKGTVK
jgi:hypothetical protein